MRIYVFCNWLTITDTDRNTIAGRNTTAESSLSVSLPDVSEFSEFANVLRTARSIFASKPENAVYTCVQLHVESDNASRIHLYQSRSFHSTGACDYPVNLGEVKTDIQLVEMIREYITGEDIPLEMIWDFYVSTDVYVQRHENYPHSEIRHLYEYACTG